MPKSDDSKANDITRREFLDNSVKTGIGVALAATMFNQAATASTGEIPQRTLGKTGVDVSALCLGGWHIGAVGDKREAIKIMHAAVNHGVTFFDNSWDYHDGGSEEIMGRALAMESYRDKVFLMTKGCERDYQGAMNCIDESLRRLKTDRIDLWQFHEIVYDNDPDWVFEKNGIAAAIEAQKAGKIRFIGFTGHRDPRIHSDMLDKPYPWDTVQMPINMMDAHFRSFRQDVVPRCLQDGAGIIGMKSLGGGVIPAQAGISAETCIRYALSQPISSLVVGMLSMDDLLRNVETAKSFIPMSESEQKSLVDSVKEVAGDGRYELYKTTQRMDGPYHVKQHGFEVT